MPELPVASGAEVVRALQRAGFEFERQRGSHAVLVHRTRHRVVVVPLHGDRDVTPGTLRSILKQAGLSVDRLRELLG